MKKLLIILSLTFISIAIPCAASAEISSEFVGVYEGWYYANQGQTGLTLTVTQDGSGIFEFYNMPGHTNAANGSYSIEAYNTDKGFALKGVDWIDQPSGYSFVSLDGKLDGDVYSGLVNNQSSWEFILTKNNDNYQQIMDSTFSNHRYVLFTDSLNWKAAEEKCESLGGHLVTINSAAEQQYIENLLANSDLSSGKDIWIGLSRENNEFQTWVTGEDVLYSNWGDPQPDNLGGSQNYGVIVNGSRQGGSYHIEQYQWDDNSDSSRPYICEWETWTDAAEWSTPELERAEDYNLIPDVLVAKDMTQPITRGEFAAIAVKLFEAMTHGKAVMSSTCTFGDIYYNENRNYILKAYNIGSVNGISSDSYDPDSLISREQIATMLTRVYKRAEWPEWTLDTDDHYTINFSGVKKFDDDALISDYAKPSVYFMVKYNVLTGIGDNKFAPKNSSQYEEAVGYANATREQAIVMSLRSFENLK